MTPNEKKDSLLGGLKQVRAEILLEAQQFRPGEVTIPFVGVWSLIDLLAHLAGWDVTNKQAVQEVLLGVVPSFYQYQGKDWADYNKILVREYGKHTLAQMLATVEHSHQELITFLDSLPAEALFTDHDVRVGSYRVLINRLLEAERKDESRHLQQMVKFLNQRRT